MRFFTSEACHRTLTLTICQVLWLAVLACSGDSADDSTVDVERDADQGSGEGDSVPAAQPDCEDPCELVFQNVDIERPSNFAQIMLVNRQTQPIDVIDIRLENSSTATGFTRSKGQMLVNRSNDSWRYVEQAPELRIGEVIAGEPIPVNPDEQLEIQLGFGPVPSTVDHGCPSGNPEDCGVLVVDFGGNVESLRVPLSIVFGGE